MFYTTIIVNRPEPYLTQLVKTLKNLDPTAGLYHHPNTNEYIIKKSTPWTPQQITAATNAIINAPNQTPNTDAVVKVETFPIEIQSLILVLVDEINILRAQHGLTARTPQQAFQAIRNKAETL